MLGSIRELCIFHTQELRRHPQRYFRIPALQGKGLSKWDPVSHLLKNVASSTLPSVKLRAIVDAASELFRLYRVASSSEDGARPVTNKREIKDLGADDFLPIFIYCVVFAEMERPVALCALLRTLCDPINRMGEVGYYFASFEAAISHIREMDLSESREEMFSLLSIPLNEESFDRS